MPVIKALDLAYGRLLSPDLDRQERPRLALTEVSQPSSLGVRLEELDVSSTGG